MALLAVAWLLGLPELAIVCTGSIAVMVLAAVVVLAHRPALGVERTVSPARITDGERGEVRLQISNLSRLPSPVVSVADDAGAFGNAQLLLAPIAAGSRATGTYALPPARRGLHAVGPMRVSRQDVFGLVRSDRTIDNISTFIVWPSVHDLNELPPAPGDEPEHSTRSPTAAATMDEEFAALRDYVAGDDIRRIHWASTARRGTPVVRHFEQPWLRRVTVLIDLRASSDDEAFERVVSAAASILRLAARSGSLVRLVNSDGGDTGFVAADDSVESLTDELAVLGPVAATRSATASTAALVSSLSNESGWLLVLSADAASMPAEQTHPSCRVLCTASRSEGRAGAGAADGWWDGTRPLEDVWSELVGSTLVPR